MKKFLKVSGIVLGTFVLLYVIACLAGPNELKVTRSIAINAPANEVFEQVGDFSNWSKWSMMFLFQGRLIEDFEGGLANLKKVCENG